MRMKIGRCACVYACAMALTLSVTSVSVGQMRITEYMYSGDGAEFVEFTNVGVDAVDMTGWSFADDSAVPGTVDLSAFGVVAAGQSVILTDADDAATFIADWGLTGVTVIAGSTAGLGREDEINLYDASDVLVDTLIYGDERFTGTPRTKDVSGWPCAEAVGANNVYQWNESTVGDGQGSYAATSGDTGSPGTFATVSCGTPASGACCASGVCTDGTAVECFLLGGIYQGDGTECATTDCPVPSPGMIRITEFMYKGGGGEFFEITNLDVDPVDMTGWSYDDDSATPGTVDLSALGTLASGESAIVTESVAADFLAEWSLTGVKIVGESGAGLGRNDQINIFDGSGTLVDQLGYGDEDYPGTIRTDGRSGWPCGAAVGNNDIGQWLFASVGDVQGSIESTEGAIGNPGAFVDHDCATTPTGACCDSLGGCTDLTATECLLAGDSYEGDATDCATFTCPAPSEGIVRITEYMYSGEGDEFVEFTNLDTNPIDLTGWSFDDDSNVPGSVDLSAFGTLSPGESVILTEGDAVTFAADWSLTGVKIIGESSEGLGRGDQINLYDGSGVLVDRLTYGDEDFPGTIRTKDASGWPCEDAVGVDDINNWLLSFEGDLQGSVLSANGDVGHPGAFLTLACILCGNGRVDAGEDCDGGDCCTASCTFVASGTECRASTGVCDAAEVCDGAGADCPEDALEPSTTECRASAGNCDPAEFCTGASAECPADLFDSTTVCRPSAGECDPEEVCDGSGPSCPADVLDSTTVCRPSAGECDIAETCNGTDAECPADEMQASGVLCSDDGNECTSDICDGIGASCTHPDNLQCGACCMPNSSCRDDLLSSSCVGLGGTFIGSGEVCDGDSDGDGVADVCDVCPGVSDADFGPECQEAIPTVSEWGLVVLALLLAVAGKVCFGRRFGQVS